MAFNFQGNEVSETYFNAVSGGSSATYGVETIVVNGVTVWEVQAQPDVAGLTTGAWENVFNPAIEPEITFSWDAVSSSGNVGYIVEFSSLANFSSTQSYYTTGTSISTVSGGYTPGSLVFVRVKAFRGTRTGGMRGNGATLESPSGIIVPNSNSANWANIAATVPQVTYVAAGSASSFFIRSGPIVGKLDSNLNTTATSVVLDESDGGTRGFPPTGTIRIGPDSAYEIISYTSNDIPTATLSGCVRGAEGTTALAFTANEVTVGGPVEGQLWACGYGLYGQLGTTETNSDGDTPPNDNMESPIMVGTGTATNSAGGTGIVSTGVAQVSSGEDHTLILKRNGSLWATGQNYNGQLGDGGVTSNRYTPYEIVTSGVTQISAGYRYSCFVKSDGTLWCMGKNDKGQLGNGSTTGWIGPSGEDTPVQAIGSSVANVSAGNWHTLFLNTSGQLYAMGSNAQGQLGDGTTTQRNTPVQVVSSGVTQIAAGYECSLFVKSNGSLWAMGRNDEGQLGTGDITDKDGISVAAPVGNNAALVIGGALASGGSVTNASAHRVTILSSGNDFSISFDIVGTDANGTALTENLAGGNNQTQTTTGYFKTITSITAVGTPAANVSAGINADEHSPVEIVSSGVAEVYINAGSAAAFYTTTSGALYGWGGNDFGGLGLGTGTNAGYPFATTNPDTTRRLTPTQIVSQGVTHVAAGGRHTLFVKSPSGGIPGQLWSVGGNGQGQALSRFTSSGGSDPRQFTGIKIWP